MRALRSCPREARLHTLRDSSLFELGQRGSVRTSAARLHRDRGIRRPSAREWQQTGLAASTIRNRLSALSSLYRGLDGARAYNPVAGVDRPTLPRPSPDSAPLENVVQVLAALETRSQRHNRGWKTLARCKVIALTGMRHSQVGRLKREDIWLENDPALGRRE